MALPSGEIVSRPMVVRACGHEQEFQYYAVDKYRAQRLAKFQKTRCSVCVEKLNEEQQKAAAAAPSKGEALAMLPLGTQITLTRKPDGNWAGTMTSDGKTVESTGEGAQGLTVALARLWLSTHGTPGLALKPPAPAAKPAPKPVPTARPAPTLRPR
ncbi:MAG: hypothetical protein K8T89_25225 [Planctomycetes bacterium]|nr:hypothetical protein [Planctomycetota bacterium]